MIDRSHVERELETVRAQGHEAELMMQRSANVFQQSIGAAKALTSILNQIDEANALKAADEQPDEGAAK